MGVEMMNFDPLAIEVDVAPGLEERLTRPELRRKPPRACYARRELHILMRGYVHNTREGTERAVAAQHVQVNVTV